MENKMISMSHYTPIEPIHSIPSLYSKQAATERIDNKAEKSDTVELSEEGQAALKKLFQQSDAKQQFKNQVYTAQNSTKEATISQIAKEEIRKNEDNNQTHQLNRNDNLNIPQKLGSILNLVI